MPLSERVDERLVAALWERQAFDPRLLDRLNLTVVFRGTPSDAGGPDYQDAVFAWDGRMIASGDVEFHVRASDWYRHSHHTNPAYNRVALHVVWMDDAEGTLTQDGRRIPVLSLGRDAETMRHLLAAGPQPSLFPDPCIEALRGLTSDELSAGLRRAGLDRFHTLTARFAADLTARHPDEVLYRALLESMGYASNRAAFCQLADSVPFSLLAGVPASAWPNELLAAAGFLPPGPTSLPTRLRPDVWRLARIRPSNHPRRRLAAVGRWLQRHGGRPAESTLDAVLADPARRHMRSILLVPDDGEGGIGQGRADEIAVSVLLPFFAAMAPAMSDWDARFAEYYAPPSNRWTRLMIDMLAQAGHRISVRTAAQHQGLHHLYHAHCRPQRASGCPMSCRACTVTAADIRALAQ